MTDDHDFLFGGEGSSDPRRFINNPDLYREPKDARDLLAIMSSKDVEALRKSEAVDDDTILTFEGYRDYLCACAMIPPATVFDMGNGCVVFLERLAFHWTIKTSEIGDRTSYKDRWCYEGAHPVRAFNALMAWKDAGFEGEPGGWRRHPGTGRRRNDDGDPSSEHSNW